MATRIGDWYAFTRGQFCRSLTVYDRMVWEGGDDIGERVLRDAAMTAAAPLGGPIAVIRSSVGALPRSSSFRSVVDLPNATLADMPTSRDAREGADGGTPDTFVEVYNNAGALLGRCCVPVKHAGEVVKLSWNKEEDLCVVTTNQLCLFYNLSGRKISVERQKAPHPFTVSFADEATLWIRPVRAFSLLAGGPIPLSHVNGVTDGVTAAVPVARPGRTTVALAVATAEGVVTLDFLRTLRGALHEDRQSTTPLRAAHLPFTAIERAQDEGRDGRRAGRSPVTTALSFVSPDSHDGGSMLLLWATSFRGEVGTETRERSSSDFLHVACWDDLVNVEMAREGEDEVDSSDIDIELPDNGLMDELRELENADLGDDDVGLKRRRKLEKKREKLMARRRRKIQKKRKRERAALLLANGGSSGLATGSIFTDNVSSVKTHGAVVALEVGPYDASRVAVLTETGVLSILSSDLSTVCFTLDTRTPLNGFSIATEDTVLEAAAGATSGAHCLHNMVWCGHRYVLLHLSRAERSVRVDSGERSVDAFSPLATEAQPEQVQPYTLLLPLSDTSAVRGERINWTYDGSDAFVVVAEVDGARVVTDCGCYFLQEVPASLVALCRLQPPFHPSRDYLQAYEGYVKGKREGFVQVRACLAKHHGSCDQIFSCLLEAACSETDRAQQLLFLSAASFVLDTTSCTPNGAERITDAVNRLRILDALWRGTADEGGGTEIDYEAIAAQPAGLMPLTVGQYAVLGGLYQIRDSFRDDDSDADAGGEHNDDADLSRSLLVATQPLTANEGQVLVDRLLSRRAYQLALHVCTAYGGAKRGHVLAEWACGKILELPDVGAAQEEAKDKRQEARFRREAGAVRSIREVFAQFPNEASYVDCAGLALEKGRPELAFSLLRDEAPSGRKVVMLARMGRALEAMRTAAESGDADLLYLALNAILAGGKQGGKEVSEATGTTLLSFPDAICNLLNASVLRPKWHHILARVLLKYTPPSCRWWFASRLGFLRLSSALQGYGDGDVKDLYEACAAKAGVAPNQDGSAAEKKRRTKQRSAEDGVGERGDDVDGADDSLVLDEGDEAEGDAAVVQLLLPTLFVPKPPLLATSLCLREEDKESVQRAFGSADAFCKEASALPSFKDTSRSPEGARLALMKKVWGLDRVEGEERRRSADNALRLRGAFGDDALPALFSLQNKLDLVPFSALAPSSVSPSEALDALKRHAQLEQYQQQFAQSHKDPRFVTSAASVVDTVSLLAEHGAWADAETLRATFKLDERKFFFAKFLALCRIAKWDVLASQVLGRPPPLVPEKRPFFSSSKAGEPGGTVPSQPPPGSYEGVVETLLMYKQNELAAEYVPGISTDSAVRVDWYVNRVGAPVMGLEAAYVGEDAELIRQILQRVPQNARAQQVGAAMIAELETDN